jgi:TonB family protein
LIRNYEQAKHPNFLASVQIAFGLVLTCSLPSVSAECNEVVRDVNLGRTAMASGDYVEALRQFQQAQKLDPDDKDIKTMVAQIHSKIGQLFFQEGQFEEALREYHAALYLDPINVVTLENIRVTIKKLGFDPSSREDRIKLGDKAQESSDLVGAAIEYREALSIQQKEAQAPVSAAAKSNAQPAAIATQVKIPPPYDSYMDMVQARLKQFWFPPKSQNSLKTVVLFNVSQNGDISDLKISQSSGNNEEDQAAVKAVNDASPLLPLPDNRKSVAIAFTFKYNVHEKHRGAASEEQGELHTYLAAVEGRIEKRWLPTTRVKDQLIALSFQLDKNGAVSNINLDVPATVELNEEVTRIVRESAPFGSPPKGIDSARVQIVFSNSSDSPTLGTVQVLSERLFGSGHKNYEDQMDGWTHDLHERVKRLWMQAVTGDLRTR